MENMYRRELEKHRQDQHHLIKEIDAKHKEQKQMHENEKKQLESDRDKAIEEDKKKLAQLNKIDIENREMQYTKNL